MENKHINSIVFYINGIGEICTLTAKSILRTADRLTSGEKITPQNLMDSDEFFAIRIKANRAVIDKGHFNPTKRELDFALFQHANYVLSLAQLGQ